MMGPAFSSLDLEAVQARHNDLTREYQQSQKVRSEGGGASRLRKKLRSVASRF